MHACPQRFFLLAALALLLAAAPALAQDAEASLQQRVRELLIAWDLPGNNPDSDLKRFSGSSLDPTEELREALLLSRLPRYTDNARRRDYLASQFLPFLERQSAELRSTGEVRLLEATALRDLGRLAEAIAIAAELPADPAEQGDGYALWGALLTDSGDVVEAGRVLEAGTQFFPGNLLLDYELARQREAAGRSADALVLLEQLRLEALQAGLSQGCMLAIARRMAGVALSAGKPDGAMDSAGLVLESYPGDVQMLSVAAAAAAARRQFNLAAEYQQQYCRLAPDATAWLSLAAYYVELNDDNALAAFGQALKLEPGSSRVLSARSAWHERSGNTDAAVADLRSLLEADPDNRDATRNLARLLAGAQPGTEGEEQLRSVIRTDPTPAAYLDLLEIVGRDPLRHQEYENLYNDMLARFRNQPVVVLAHARRLLSGQKYSEALEQFQRGEGLDPSNPEFPTGAGDCLRAMGGYVEAQDAYSRALRLAYSPEAVSGLARCLERSGDSPEAERVFRDQLNAHPRDAALVMQYGLFLFERSDYTAALEQYDYAQELEPGNELAINRAALCLFNLNQIPEAISRLKAAINVQPLPLFYSNLAVAYEEDAELELAEQYYREGLELFPGDARLLEGYSEFLEQQGRSAEALDILERSARLIPEPEVLMDLATLAQSAGREDLARDSYRQALALDPVDLVINERYSTFLAMQRDNAGLLAHLEQAVHLLPDTDFDELIGTLTGFWIEEHLTDDGELLLSQLIDLQPAIVRLYNSLALMQHLAGDNDSALTTVTRGQRYAGESFLGLYLQTLISWRSLGVQEARPLAQKLIEHPQADAKAWLLYLDMLARDEDSQEEASVAARGLKRFFGNEPMYGHLVSATRELGDIRELIRVLEDPQYVRIRLEERPLLLGESYLAVGNYVKALASLQPLLEQDAFNERALRLSGEAHFMLGEQAAARDRLTTALAINPELPEASVWLGWVLLEDRDLAGAEQSFSTAEKSPALDQLQLAWTRLGQATVAIRRGERLQAQNLLQQAEALGGGDERFDSYLPRIREEIQPR